MKEPRACDGFVATAGKNTRHLVAAGAHVLKMISYSNEFSIQAVVRKESRVLQVKKYKMTRRQLSLRLRRAPACYGPAILQPVSPYIS